MTEFILNAVIGVLISFIYLPLMFHVVTRGIANAFFLEKEKHLTRMLKGEVREELRGFGPLQ